eukprot:234497_1
MAQEKKEEQVYVVAVLYLCCPGVKTTLGTGKKVAYKSGGIKNPGVGNGDKVVDLQGVYNDKKTIEQLIERVSKMKNAVSFYKQKASIYDPHLSVIEASFKIASWINAPGHMSILYFSGHGGKGYLCTSNGQKLTYEFIANCIKIHAKKLPYEKPIVMIIDACHSGSVVDAFKHIKKPKIIIHYSCGADEFSADCGFGKGGWFTSKLFDNVRAKKLYGNEGPVRGIMHTYKSGEKMPQTPGLWKNF